MLCIFVNNSLAAFAQFSSDLDPGTKAQIERGKRITEILKQPPYQPVPVEEQIAILWAVTQGYLDELPVEKVRDFENKFISHLKLKEKEILKEIAEKKELDEKLTKKLESVTKKFVETFKRGVK